MNLKCLCAAALVAASVTGTASAQSASAPGQGCEIHVYLADGVHSVGEDFDNVHELDQDVRHYYQMAGRPLDWLSPARQIELLRGSDVPALAGTGAAHTTFHSDPLTRRQAMELVPASGECVVAILVPQILLERGALSSRSLRVFGMVRRYERGVAVQRYSGYAAAPMDGFQLRSPADAPAATRLVEAAYASAVKEVLHNSTKPKNK